MKRRGTTIYLLPILGFTIFVVSLLLPLPVNAASFSDPTPQNSKIHYLRVPNETQAPDTNNLIYSDGPIMAGEANVYAIFWEPQGTYVSSSYNDLITRYFNDVSGSGLYNNTMQYSDFSGNAPNTTSLAGSWIDTSAYPSPTLSDQDIQNEVTNAMTTNGWTADPTHVFFVFLAKDENLCVGTECSFTTFCAYHSSFGTNMIYAAIPYAGTDLTGCGVPSSPNNDLDADSAINITSHEQIEAATDPVGSAWYDAYGQEIGDKCIGHYGTINADGSNVILNNNTYIVQQEWDNTIADCTLAGP